MDNWTKRCKRVCTSVLLLALLLRAAGSGSLAAAGSRGAALMQSPSFAAFLLYLQTGRRVHPSETPPPSLPSPSVPSPSVPFQTEPSADPLPTVSLPIRKPETRVFTPAEAAGLEVKYGGDYRPDLGALLARPTALDFSGDAPRILIVSTHATESYRMEDGWEYTPSAEARTLDPSYNVLRVGAELASLLRQAGICVIHDTTLNDYPSYNGAYSQASDRITAILAEYPSIQMVIDVHRDAMEDESGNQLGTAVSIGGQETARVMLVMGTNEGGLEHPYWETNLSWALKLQKIMDEQSPGLARPLNLRTERFNEQLTPGSVLLEVGTAGDTLAQALAAVRLFGQALVEAIAGV